MKVIKKREFIPTVCVIYTILSIAKIVLEAIMQGNFGGYQVNLLEMLFLAFLATFVLSQHYRLAHLPLAVVALVQYIVLIAVVMLITWITGKFTQLHTDAYRDMFWSFTIPYVVFAAAYYVALYIEVKRANYLLKQFKEEQNNAGTKSNENRKN